MPEIFGFPWNLRNPQDCATEQVSWELAIEMELKKNH
jgi:hypothetical protein